MDSSLRRGDLWAEMGCQHDEDGDQRQPPTKPQIDVVYRRRRPQDSTSLRAEPISSSRRDSRISFAPSKRTSWNRSLSIRGRESIVVAPGVNLRPPPKQKGGPRIPKQAPRAKKGGQGLPDLTKEKAYFEEVDSFDLVEESPSPKQSHTWAMGAKQDFVVHDLPAIMERWRISKLAYRCGPSNQLFKIVDTPLNPSQRSSCMISNNLTAKTPERAMTSRVPFNLTSDQRSIVSRPANNHIRKDFDERSIVTSLDALSIKDEDAAKSVGEVVQPFKQNDVSEGLGGAILKDSSALHLTASDGEFLSAFDQLLVACRQSAPVSLSEVFCKYCDRSSSIVKIGEGTYGEAFKAGETVCKVVPIDGDMLVNGEVQKKSEEVLEEVLLSLTLNSLRGKEGETNKENSCIGFIETKDFQVCQGAYDASLISAWEDWDAKHGSENDHPKEFPDKQCYIVFVLADGGKDLESFVLLNYDEARSSLVQTTVALAVAETACEFEHRDLHWGNILLTRDETTEMNFTLKGKKLVARTFGITISIIDFTLSRISTGKAILFLDLSCDPGLFEGPKGDKQKRTAKEERDLRSLKKRLSSYNSATSFLSDSFFSDLLIDDPE